MTKKTETKPKVENSPKVDETVTETVQETFEKAGDMLDDVLNQEQELPFEPEDPTEEVPFDFEAEKKAEEEAAAQKAKEVEEARLKAEMEEAQKVKEEAEAEEKLKALVSESIKEEENISDMSYDKWFERFDNLLRQKHYYSYLNCGRLLKKPIYRNSILLFKKEFAAYGCSSDIDIHVMEMLQYIPEQ